MDPKVTPYLMSVADGCCSRWLQATFENEATLPEPFLRGRIRDPLMRWLSEGHQDGGSPSIELLQVPEQLLPEEVFYLRKFAKNYLRIFVDRPGSTVDHDLKYPTDFLRRKLRVGGWVDLLLKCGEDDHLELRQLELWGGALESDPEVSWEMALALLRLVACRAIDREQTIVLCHVDLNSEQLKQTKVALPESLSTFGTQFDGRVATIMGRTANPEAQAGESCGMCSFVDRCDHWNTDTDFLGLVRQKSTFTGGLVALTPTHLKTWMDCPRKYRGRYLFNLPEQPRGDSHSMDFGLDVHRLIYQVHAERGSCISQQDIGSYLGDFSGHDVSSLSGYFNRHRAHCPERELTGEHEVTLARLHHGSPRPFMLTGRIDAIWIHDGLLDARDYKTGRLHFERTGDDFIARVQAWLLEPLATESGLSLRLQHEYLAAEILQQPVPFMPETEDLEEIGLQISAIANEIFESDFQGSSDPAICGWCGYADSCPDSALLDDDTVISFVTPPD